ncbi:MAG TPA: prepilin-type N-terminal cleavage/methylation domain-containing protein [Candidatus Hydrogenedentes bacterium]|jgi:prepilin-type N-terminal cleavage/methylation domain-containing protein|nr:prepilin-type N-terminal cleavage/methylation domain-containing protein [Candidatus Hydrogenedentota bacterium]
MRRGVSWGFTLIELLVTLTIFTLVFSSLIVGLRSGTHAWKRVREHQASQASLERALRTFSGDLRNLVRVSEEEGFISEGQQDDGNEAISFACLDSRRSQRAGVGAVWVAITYRVEESDETGQTMWVREAMPYTGQSRLGSRPERSVLLENVQSVRFDYLQAGQGTVSIWEDAERPPSGVQCSFTLAGQGRIVKTVALPVGITAVGSQ